MKFKTISFTFFSLVMFYSPLAFAAAWTTNSPPSRPTDNVARTCIEWICYYGFTPNNYRYNRQQSITRAFKLDRFASTWAALYAYTIGGEDTPPELLPKDFCDYRGAANYLFPFNDLEHETGTCTEWIMLYGFTADNKVQNYIYARNQHFVKNYEISLWADNYSEYLNRFDLRFALTPIEFCASLGKNVAPETMLSPFMSRRDAKFTCETWIKLYDFIDDLRYNIIKAQIKYRQKLLFHIHFWAINYSRYLRDMGEFSQKMTCTDWICFYGFKADNSDENRTMANERDNTLDRYVSLWAASYTYVISGFSNTTPVLPQEFCDAQGVKTNKQFLFVALQDEKRNCEEWIHLYGYDSKDTIMNWHMAENRSFEVDQNISLWATGYAKSITISSENSAIPPSEYCLEIGKTVGPQSTSTQFVTYATELTCEEWIKLFDFTDDLENNFEKAKTVHRQRYAFHINFWARNYAFILRVRDVSRAEKPRDFCNHHGLDDKTKISFYSI